jgi:hypothetical protein
MSEIMPRMRAGGKQKIVFFIFCFVSVFFTVKAQQAPVIWTWLNGSSIPNQYNGVYSSPGVAAPSNKPPAARESFYWYIPATREIYAFGGVSSADTTFNLLWAGVPINSCVFVLFLVPSAGTKIYQLWKYSIPTGLWTFVAGNSTILELLLL